MAKLLARVALRILLPRPSGENTRHKFQKLQTFKMKWERVIGVADGTERWISRWASAAMKRYARLPIRNAALSSFEQCLASQPLKLPWRIRNKWWNISLKSSATSWRREPNLFECSDSNFITIPTVVCGGLWDSVRQFTSGTTRQFSKHSKMTEIERNSIVHFHVT